METKSLSNGRHNKMSVHNRCQRHKIDAIRKIAEDTLEKMQRQMSLADAARASECQ
jgi:hypothetical protein